jgi:hypothetical protein
MEPRGDRMIGLGYDNTTGTGSLQVSLFDVTDLTAPALIDRANFGGEWGWFSEDQDRIQKAFKVLDDAGLILMPFSGWTTDANSAEPTCYGTWKSGVQLIDWANDTLTLRGIAPTMGSARRGFLHNDRLFAMSDDRVEAFDITNRDAPAPTSKVALSHNVTQVLPAGDKVVRLSQNWWTNATELDAVSLDAATVPSTDGDLEIAQQPNGCYKSEYLQNAFSTDSRAYLVYQSYDYDPNTQVSTQGTAVKTVDISGPSPVLLGSTPISDGPNNQYYYSYYTPYGLIDHGSPLVALGDTLVMTYTEVDYTSATPKVTTSELRVADLTDPTNAAVKAITVPTGLGATGLVTSGSVVARSHYETSPTHEGSVRFYMDRVDVSDPANPKALRKINIPGSLLAFDEAAQRALTVDYRSQTTKNVLASDCYSHGYASFYPPDPTQGYSDTTLGDCVQLLFSVNLVSFDNDVAELIGSKELPEGQSIGQVALGDNVAFITQAAGYGYRVLTADVGIASGAAIGCFGPCYYGGGSFAEQDLPVVTLGGLQGGAFKSGSLNVKGGDYWGYAPIVAQGTRAALSGGWRGKLSVIDASDVTAPSLVRDVEISGYVSNLVLVGSTAVASMGYDGVQTISLGD